MLLSRRRKLADRIDFCAAGVLILLCAGSIVAMLAWPTHQTLSWVLFTLILGGALTCLGRVVVRATHGL